jgi:hypothetical protein
MLTTILIIFLAIGYLMGAAFISMWMDWQWLYLPDLIKALLFPIFMWFEK